MASTACFLHHHVPSTAAAKNPSQRFVVSARPTQLVCKAQKQTDAAAADESQAVLSRRLALTVLVGAASVGAKVNPADAAYGEAGSIMSSSNRAPQRDGKAPASPVPPSPPAPQAPPSPSTYSPDYWKGFYIGWKMALHKASPLYDHKGLMNIISDIGPRAEHICSSPSSYPSPARSSSSPPASTE
ncbi:hypothetical protein Taro_024856 [Colocasia esculenta]|uniref:Uncharacterized protein n=1 Tax=Colocasia esculenta TaxID=4460 RepID=A0A843VLM0_COLES|nr:hypothetical protein [Colocasia esculenta]